MNALESAATRPFLTAFAVVRTDAEDLPGRYCPDRDVWVVEDGNGTVPLVAAAAIPAYEPVTKVRGERDKFSALAQLELVTKTHQQMERDDTSPRDNTAVPYEVREVDGIRSPTAHYLLELRTKTETTRERDE